MAPSSLAVAPPPRIDMADLAAYPSERRIRAVAVAGEIVRVACDDGREGRFHAIWLRDNCPCPACRHPQTMERQFLFIDAPPPVLATAAPTMDGSGIELRFAATADVPAHVSRFDAGWLRQHCYAEWARAERCKPPRLWDAALAGAIPSFEHGAIMTDDAALAAWLEALCETGVTIIRNAPSAAGEVRRTAERVGPVRATNFGLVFDVVSLPRPNSSAYTAIGLEPHTDLANVRRPPDFQLLFCIANRAAGGGSFIVDGFRVASALRDADPEGYGLLARFWRLLREPRFQLCFRLSPGEMIAFDNLRILHGRDPFDPGTGERRLQGCYLDRDTVMSRRRLLARGRGNG